jgi:hypothetical protein
MDGRSVARYLNELEGVLNGPILSELKSLLPGVSHQDTEAALPEGMFAS